MSKNAKFILILQKITFTLPFKREYMRTFRLFVILGFAMLCACSGSETKTTKSDGNSTEAVKVDMSKDPEKDGRKMLEELLECVQNDQPDKMEGIISSYIGYYSNTDEDTKFKFLTAFQKSFNQLSDEQYLDWVKMVNAYQAQLTHALGNIKSQIEEIQEP